MPVGKHFRQCFVIPLLWMVQDHRHGLEIRDAGRLRERFFNASRCVHREASTRTRRPLPLAWPLRSQADRACG